MTKEFRCSQWLIRDNQQTNYQEFFVTKKHYTNKADVWRDYSPEKTEYCFHPIRSIKDSLLTGELAEAVYWTERQEEKYPL